MTVFPGAFRRFVMVAACLYGACAAAQVSNSAQPAAASRTYRVAGTIVNQLDGNPLASARVTLQDLKNSEKTVFMITSENGRFEFSGVPGGRYALTGAKRGFIPASYDQHEQFSTHIVTGAGVDTENLVLKIAPTASIAGSVFDEAGEPVRNASVNLYHEDHSQGEAQIRNSRGAQTDDLGAFELTGLTPGTYFLSVNAKPWYAVHPPVAPGRANSDEESAAPETFDPSLDVAYSITYYANEFDSDSASPIAIRGGERLQLDMHLTPVPSLRLRFRVPNNGRSPFMMPQIEHPSFDGVVPLQFTTVRTSDPGVWEVSIPAGRYDIQFAAGQQSPGARIDGVELKTDGQEVDASAAQSLSSVKVSVHLLGETAIPKGLMVGLRGSHRSAPVWQNVSTKGDAEFRDIPAGRYEVMVSGENARYSITRIEGIESVGYSINLAPGSSPALTVTLSSGSVDIQGVVKRAGKPFAGAMVVLVPANSEGSHDLFRRAQSNLDGSFNLREVVPGSYTVVAVENGWDMAWLDPNVIAPYLKHGRRVQVSGENHAPVNLPEPVVAQ
jgi:hypothetical protein